MAAILAKVNAALDTALAAKASAEAKADRATKAVAKKLRRREETVLALEGAAAAAITGTGFAVFRRLLLPRRFHALGPVPAEAFLAFAGFTMAGLLDKWLSREGVTLLAGASGGLAANAGMKMADGAHLSASLILPDAEPARAPKGGDTKGYYDSGEEYPVGD